MKPKKKAEKHEPMLKDWKKVYRRIQTMRGFDEHEKILIARSLAATPDERWQDERDLSPLARLMGSLGEEKIGSK
jgi:hypothetical protein